MGAVFTTMYFCTNGEKIEQANVHLNLLPYGIPVAVAALRDPLKIIVVAQYNECVLPCTTFVRSNNKYILYTHM